MAAPVTNSEDQREQRLANIAKLYLMGQTQAAIGRQFGVSQPQICYDLKIVRTRWLESSIRNFDDAKAEELAKIDRVEAEFWAAWDRSQKIKQVTSTKRKEPKDASTEVGVRKEEQAGDPRFLDGVLKCIQKRCEILSLDAPSKLSLLDKDRNNYGPFLTDEERRARVLALLGESYLE